MKQRILLAGIISCVLFGLMVFGILSLRPSAFSGRARITPSSDPRWTGTLELVLRQTRDGGWAVFPVTTSTINQLFGTDYFSSGKRTWSEPTDETIKSCRFPPAIELPPDGVAREESDGSSLWLKTVAPNPRLEYVTEFGGREFVNLYTGPASFLPIDWVLDPAKIYEKFSIANGDNVLDICESPTQALIVAVLQNQRSRRVTMRFFDALTRVQVGSDLLLIDADPRSAGGYKMLQGWTPDGQWLVMTGYAPSDNQLSGSNGFERIWVVSLKQAGIAPAQRKSTK